MLEMVLSPILIFVIRRDEDMISIASLMSLGGKSDIADMNDFEDSVVSPSRIDDFTELQAKLKALEDASDEEGKEEAPAPMIASEPHATGKNRI